MRSMQGMSRRIRDIAVFFAFAVNVVVGEDVVTAVDPNAFLTRSTTCAAQNRSTGEAKEIQISYVDVNPGAEKTILMVHGWPSLWHSWKYQIEEFKTDYHLVVPNLRGFGDSGHPGDVQTSGTMGDMVGDLVCVLNELKVSKVACVGHDWGAQVCYEAARMRPDIVEAVVAIGIPYLPYNGPFLPIEQLTPMLPKLSYNLYFEHHTNDAIQELNTDVRRTLRGTLRTVASPPPNEFLQQTDSFLKGWSGVETIPPISFFTPDEEQYWVEKYQKSGFNFTLNFYTYGNRHASWELAQKQGNHTIIAPTLSILPIRDPVADWVLASKLLKSSELIPKLTTETVEAAHWLQLEKPDEVNSITRKWLNQWYPSTGEHATTQPRDEL